MAKSFPNTGVTTGTAADRAALASPFAGMEFFETDTNKVLVYNGSAWVEVSDLDNVGAVSDATGYGTRVFTNEAARDAAITSPAEGMVAHLTSPTEVTGNWTLYKPASIRTVYNGSQWVNTTFCGSLLTNGSYHTNTSFANLFTGSNYTPPRIQIRVGSVAEVHIFGNFFGGGSGQGEITCAVDGIDNNAVRTPANSSFTYRTPSSGVRTAGSATWVLTGLTPGLVKFDLCARRIGGSTVEGAPFAIFARGLV